ncbi:hypothetical protein BA895_19915 [Humibacillus sp. DSM 29435]|uniref:GAP1-N2 domain-containing protein n=1 Tax=Humibacillus sp. DSM 29435 TaxID=1869167 RepID=UPI000871B8FB|nr:hypothetical protein [Humibacillus sp. DSM 29435]OFE16158.1 hypothetical protein BA895_19915 [Humibacillus sp. DSM 29435]
MQELTYGSADGIPGRQAQGWGVLRRVGDLDPAIEKSLLEGVSVFLPTTMSKFPSAADLARRPVRLRYAVGRDEAVGLWWRSIEAGLDHTQRPGNVFTHAVASQVPADTRPSDFALSPQWLSPFGADQVRDATPSGDFTLPTDPAAHGIAAVLRWLHCSRGVAVPAVSWLVDTAIQALMARTPVVLRGVSSEDAWGWIALISWLLPSSVGTRIGFSTGEEPASLGKALELGALLAAVPGADPLPPQRDRVCELDPRWQVDAEAALTSGSWALPNGTHFPVTAWATVGRDFIWLDPASAHTTLRRRDELYDPLLAAGLPYADAAPLAVRLGLLATPGAVIMGRSEMLVAALDQNVLPVELRSHPQIAPLVAEAGPALPQALLDPGSSTNVAATPREFDVLAAATTVDLAPAVFSADEASVVEPRPRFATTDWTSEIEVMLVKNTPDLHGQADLLDELPYPGPASMLPAATMVARHCSLDAIGEPRRWVPLLLTLPPLGRLALLHCISQAAPTALPDEDVARLMAALAHDPQLDRYLSPLLLLLLRAEAAGGDALLPWGQRPAWHRDLGDFVAGLDPDEAAFLALPFLELVVQCDPPNASLRRAGRDQVERWAAEPQAAGLWSLPCADGRPLARVVADNWA